MKTLNLITVVKEYNSNKSIIIQEVFYLSSVAAVPRLQYYNYYSDGNSIKMK